MLGLTHSSVTFFTNAHSTLLELLKGLATRPRVENDVYNLCNRYISNLALGLLCVGGEKRAWYVLFAHAQFPQDFWEFGNFHKICSVTPTSTRYANFSLYRRCLSLTMLCVDGDKGVTRALSYSLAGIVHVFVEPS